MSGLREKLIHLAHCPSVNWKQIFTLLQQNSSLQNLYEYSPSQLQKLLTLSIERANQIKKDLQTIPIRDILDKYDAENIQCVTILDDEYPELLRHIYDPPWVLFARGNLSLLHASASLSVVGTRNPTSYGTAALTHIVKPMLHEEFVVVSGLALGIDQAAHELAIAEKAKTIAVLGGGFYNIYPRGNQNLAREIAQHHLLLSEYAPFMKPTKWFFPRRNRIISGLTGGTLVVQAKERSGPFITADQALQQGREVFAIPGSIFEETSCGTNKLIQLGAKLVQSAADITDEMMYIR
ncbi:DNA-processing protein DprA [Priestia aryabhattai]|uniref:DNA-processing protein DprA n=1 Tax=Priestia aryabhattai TaxID=412384 RepID=UPI0039835F38